LHGWGGNENSFLPIVKYFSRFYNCLSPSMPCFQKGGPDKHPTRPWTLDDYAEYTENILRDSGIKRCHIVCHSFGARVAVLLIKRNPKLVDKLVVCGGAGLKARFNLQVWLKIKIYKIKRRLLNSVRRLFGRPPLGRIAGGSADYRSLTENGKKTFINIIRRDLAGEINTVQTPTLLIYGRHDRATPPYMGRRWAKLCKTAKLKIYDTAGHFAYLDEPAKFIKDTAKFIQNNNA
jgi:pimeloyl-ACP methyl ester carboxylesterase